MRWSLSSQRNTFQSKNIVIATQLHLFFNLDSCAPSEYVLQQSMVYRRGEGLKSPPEDCSRPAPPEPPVLPGLFTTDTVRTSNTPGIVHDRYLQNLWHSRDCSRPAPPEPPVLPGLFTTGTFRTSGTPGIVYGRHRQNLWHSRDCSRPDTVQNRRYPRDCSRPAPSEPPIPPGLFTTGTFRTAGNTPGIVHVRHLQNLRYSQG